MNNKLQEFAAQDTASCAVVLLWTGRTNVEFCLARVYGSVFTKNWSAPSVDNLVKFLRRIFRFYHPQHKNGPNDADAARLLEQLDTMRDVQLTDEVAPGFFQYLQEKRVLPLSTELHQAWAAYKKQLHHQADKEKNKREQARAADMENAPPPHAATKKAAPGTAPMQEAVTAAPPIQDEAAATTPIEDATAASPMQDATTTAPMQDAA